MEKISLLELKLVGISTQTNNRDEMDVDKAKIGSTMQQYFQSNIINNVSNRVKPGITYCVYTDYESDEHGNYTYFIGEQVSSFNNITINDNSNGVCELNTLIVPSNTYQRFTTETGPIPTIIINAWHKIWHMTPAQLKGKRNYIADFEVYDSRAQDVNNATVDIYIGIQDINDM